MNINNFMYYFEETNFHIRSQVQLSEIFGRTVMKDGAMPQGKQDEPLSKWRIDVTTCD